MEPGELIEALENELSEGCGVSLFIMKSDGKIKVVSEIHKDGRVVDRTGQESTYWGLRHVLNYFTK